MQTEFVLLRPRFRGPLERGFFSVLMFVAVEYCSRSPAIPSGSKFPALIACFPGSRGSDYYSSNQEGNHFSLKSIQRTAFDAPFRPAAAGSALSVQVIPKRAIIRPRPFRPGYPELPGDCRIVLLSETRTSTYQLRIVPGSTERKATPHRQSQGVQPEASGQNRATASGWRR